MGALCAHNTAYTHTTRLGFPCADPKRCAKRLSSASTKGHFFVGTQVLAARSIFASFSRSHSPYSIQPPGSRQHTKPHIHTRSNNIYIYIHNNVNHVIYLVKGGTGKTAAPRRSPPTHKSLLLSGAKAYNRRYTSSRRYTQNDMVIRSSRSYRGSAIAWCGCLVVFTLIRFS